MTLRKIFTLGIILAMFLVVPAAYAVTVMWDEYSDSNANKLIIESSPDQSVWSTAVDSINTGETGAVIPAGPDNTRVYYRMKAVDTDAEPDIVSGPSNTASYYWTTAGGGQIGLQSPGSFGFIDCTGTLDGAETKACTDSGELP